MYVNVLLHFLEFLIFYRAQNVVANPLIGTNIRRVQNSEFPSVACIIVVFDDSVNDDLQFQDEIICSGSLVSSYHILTAEHCSEYTNTHRIQIVLGATDVRLGQRYDPLWWISHNQWSIRQLRRSRYRVNDISMIKLIEAAPDSESPFELSTIRRINLFGLEVALAGWGELANTEMTYLMHTGNVTILSDNECTDTYIIITNTYAIPPLGEFCSIANPFVVLGDGDSGGPIFSGNVILGVNTAIVPDTGEISQKINVHASVFFYRNFINDLLEA